MTPSFPIFTGFEPTRIFHRKEHVHDVLLSTQHYQRYPEDLDLMVDTGIRTLRVAAPWHRIEPLPGAYDWAWMDAYMGALQARGIQPIMDPLHHVSVPSWLRDGFADAQFVDRFTAFVEALMERYAWVQDWNIVNEPYVTCHFAGRVGVWFPFKRSEAVFFTMLGHMALVIQRLSQRMAASGKRHWYIDACEAHRGYSPAGVKFAARKCQERFYLLDLCLGRVDKKHPAHKHFASVMSPEALEGLRQSPAVIDVLGLDYYAHCEFEWTTTRRGRLYRRENREPIGFAAAAMQYAERYRLPVALTETNIRGYVSDRLSWFCHMYRQCLQLKDTLRSEELEFHGFCWYPFIDSTDWDSLLRRANGHIDPQGLVWLDPALRRHRSELTEAVRDLASGVRTIDDIHLEPFRPPLDRRLRGFVNNLMKDYPWKGAMSLPVAAPA